MNVLYLYLAVFLSSCHISRSIFLFLGSFEGYVWSNLPSSERKLIHPSSWLYMLISDIKKNTSSNYSIFYFSFSNIIYNFLYHSYQDCPIDLNILHSELFHDHEIVPQLCSRRPVRYASVHMVLTCILCVSRKVPCAVSTVKLELGQWIRITIGCTQLKLDNLDFHFNCTARTDTWLRTWLRIKYAKLKIDCQANFEPRRLSQFCSFFSQ